MSQKLMFSLSRNLLTFITSNKLLKCDLSKAVLVQDAFKQAPKKDKNTYLELIEMFIHKDKYRRGHVEFIYAAMQNMEEFSVHKDLNVYKAIVDVLPKGKFIPTNFIQAEFMHYPKQQQCIIDLLEQMEDNGVLPDEEMEDMLLNIFGARGYPLRKFWRMMYWMPKFKNLSPWPLPRPVPNDTFELAKLALSRISIDIQSKICVYNGDDQWIVSSISPVQKCLIKKHNKEEPIFIEGAFRVWLREKSINYFILRASPLPVNDDFEDIDDVGNIDSVPLKPKPTRNVHMQNDGIILSMCVTKTSCKDSLLSWIRNLEEDGNPSLKDVPVVFLLKSPTTDLAF